MPILALRAVSTSFGGLPAVDDVSFDVAAGQVLAVIGPNGAGKSTLLGGISGLRPPTSGSITLDGEELTGLPTHAIRRRGIATVLQHPRVFASRSVRDNAALGAMFGTPGGRRAEAAARRAGDDALEVVGLAGVADRPADRLTLHQRRTLDLARAIAGQPRVLLLDEVMAGLGPGELAASIALVRRLRDELGLTVVWVEHVMRAVRALADEVVVLDAGRLLADGRPDEVMADPRVVAAYLGEGAVGA